MNLGPDAPEAQMSSDTSVGEKPMSEELTGVEQSAFVGLEWRSVRLDGDHLTVTIDFSRPLGKEAQASVYLIGYRPDVPFAEMPKLHVQVGALGHKTYDQQKELPADAIQVVRQPTSITLRVPLSLLGNPQKALIDAQTYLGDLPLDSVAWRVLELQK